MKSPWIMLGLAMSALFNVFFLAGYAKARRTAGGQGSDVTERVRSELGLDRVQSALFDDLRQKWREDAEVYGENLALVRQDMVEELDRESRDPARVGDVLEREAELRRQWRYAEAGRFGDFLGALTPEQRRKLMGRLEHGGPRHGGMFMKKFDTNQNGTLEPEERAAARELMRSRFAQRPRHWPQPGGEPEGDGRQGGERRGDRPGPSRLRGELMRRFDADRDGRLGPPEEAALLEWIRQPMPAEAP